LACLAAAGGWWLQHRWANAMPAQPPAPAGVATFAVGDSVGAYLQQFHSPGVPLYVVYPRGGGAGHALPTVLTASLVRNALVHADMEPAAR
jgi:hypothetical protein